MFATDVLPEEIQEGSFSYLEPSFLSDGKIVRETLSENLKTIIPQNNKNWGSHRRTACSGTWSFSILLAYMNVNVQM